MVRPGPRTTFTPLPLPTPLNEALEVDQRPHYGLPSVEVRPAGNEEPCLPNGLFQQLAAELPPETVSAADWEQRVEFRRLEHAGNGDAAELILPRPVSVDSSSAEVPDFLVRYGQTSGARQPVSPVTDNHTHSHDLPHRTHHTPPLDAWLTAADARLEVPCLDPRQQDALMPSLFNDLATACGVSEELVHPLPEPDPGVSLRALDVSKLLDAGSTSALSCSILVSRTCYAGM